MVVVIANSPKKRLLSIIENMQWNDIQIRQIKTVNNEYKMNGECS